MLLPPVRRATDSRVVRGVASFAGGTFFGGALTAVAIWVCSGLLASLPMTLRYALLAIFALLALAREFNLIAFATPSSQRLIPITRFSRSMLCGMFLFGFELGLGFRTKIVNVGPYLLMVILLLLPPAPLGILAVSAGWAVGRTFAFLARVESAIRMNELSDNLSVRIMNAYERRLEITSRYAVRLLAVTAAATAFTW